MLWEAGQPRQLTWVPAADVAVGWTPDGKRVLFFSGRDAWGACARLYTVSDEGGPAEVLPMWRAENAWFSPDGTQIAYVPNLVWQRSWKRYRGGQTTPIYILRLSDLALERVPRENSNDSHPVWFGDSIYFLSHRNGALTLFAYDTKTKAVRQVVENNGLDFKSLSAGPDLLVYEQFGGISLFDPASGKSKKVSVRMAGDLWSTHCKKIADTDKRLKLWYVDAELGTPVRVTTDRCDDQTSGSSETWSPGSKWLSYAKLLANHLRAVFVYSVESGKESQITDGISDARYPVFDKGGKSLFFAVSTDVGLSAGWLDLSSFQHPVLRSVYAAVLKKGDASPVEPQSDDEKAAAEKKDAAGLDKAKDTEQSQHE